MFLLTSYSLSIFEYLNAGHQYAVPADDVPFRTTLWEFLHELGACLQSMSMFFFSVERVFASCFQNRYEKPIFKLFIIFTVVISVFVSSYVSISITICKDRAMILPTAVMSFIDFIGLGVLITAWKTSISNYRSTSGKVPLGRRFQMSEVFTWTSTLLPAIVLVTVLKLLSIVPIWIWLIFGLTDAYYGIANSLYNSILNINIVIFPWILLVRNKRLKKRIRTLNFSMSPFSTKNQSALNMSPIRTLEGKEINMRPSQADYFQNLKHIWK